uniref:Uncharacterized protein n=1 Tax=viral metagenome TaxID=1070528 RepID=A0A6C0ETY2_9ZZZZ
MNMGIDVKRLINDCYVEIVEIIYPSCFGICIFLFANHKHGLNQKNDELFDKSFSIGIGLYLSTFIYKNYSRHRYIEDEPELNEDELNEPELDEHQ